MTTGQEIKLPFFTRDKVGAPYIASVDIQWPLKPVAMIVDGERFDLKDAPPVLPGQRIRRELPESASYTSAVAFVCENAAEMPTDGPTVCPAKIEVATEASPKMIAPGEEVRIEMRSDDLYRIVRFETDVKVVCGTCRGSRQVGFMHHKIECPACKADVAAARPGDLPFVKRRGRVVVAGVFLGVDVMLGTLGDLPIEALESVGRGRVVLPGLLVHVHIRNDDTAPVVVRGFVVGEKVDSYTPPTPPWRSTIEGRPS